MGKRVDKLGDLMKEKVGDVEMECMVDSGVL